MLELVPLSEIKDNPHRDKKRNPIDAVKVGALVESIKSTAKREGKDKGFWKGIYGRRVGKFVEIAFGHNRVEAARIAGLKSIWVEVEEFTDADMLMRMTRENLRGDLVVALEAVQAAVKAFGAGTMEFEAASKDTRKDNLRYAPSFVPGKAPVDPGSTRTYSADTLARSLGGIYVMPDGHAQAVVRAALGVLEMEERQVKGFSEKVLQVNNVDPSGRYVGAKQIIAIVAEIKEKEIKVQERAERSAEDIRAEKAKAEALQAKIKEREAADKKIHDELLAKRVAAQVEKNAAEVKRVQQQIKAKTEEAEAKAEADKAKLKALEANVAAKKEAAKEAAKVDEYLPHRKEVDRIIHLLERRDLAEDLKALSRRPLTLKDRERVWEAIDGLAAWLSSWAAVQFNGPLKATQRRKR